MGTSAILFAIAAVGGAVMAAMRLQGKERPPLWLALVHGGVAAAALILLIYVAFKAGGTADVPTLAKGAVAGFLVAAFGGFVLFLQFHLKKKPLPIPVMLVHALVAVLSFVTLLVGIFAR